MIGEYFQFYRRMDEIFADWLNKKCPGFLLDYALYAETQTLAEVYFLDLPAWMFRCHPEVMDEFLSFLSEAVENS